jgi:hypothetical protein
VTIDDVLALEPETETPRGRKRPSSPSTVKLSPARGAVPHVVERLARELNETNTELLAKVVGHLGVAASLDCLQQTHKCMRNGGMMVADGHRRRTRCGVFLKLAQEQMSAETRKLIWADETRKKRQRRKHIESKKLRDALEESEAPLANPARAEPEVGGQELGRRDQATDTVANSPQVGGQELCQRDQAGDTASDLAVVV